MTKLILFLVFCLSSFNSISAKEASLLVKDYEEISFDDIPKTKYSNVDGQLLSIVKKSSSILLQPFSKKQTVKTVKVVWKKTGDLKTKSFDHETTKSGDDAYFRVGLIVSGEAPTIPFFAPAWIKKSKEILKLPSDKMIYLTVGSKAAAGKTWPSPYSGSIESMAPQKSVSTGEWTTSEFTLSKATEIVGLWIFADGDNTESSFNVSVKSIEI